MEQLKRWRDDRAARQSRRLLDGGDPPESLPPLLPRAGGIEVLGRWHDERAARQSRRILGPVSRTFHLPDMNAGVSDPIQLKRWRDERAHGHVRDILENAPQGTTLPRRASRMNRKAPRDVKRRFSLWPVFPKPSPVHPEWDDPSYGRLKRSLYGSMAVHMLAIPGLILLSHVDFSLNFMPSRAGGQKFQVVNRVLPMSEGRVKAPPPVKPNPVVEKQEPPKPKPAPPKPKTEEPKPVIVDDVKPVKIDEIKNAIPKPVPDKNIKPPASTPPPAPPAENTSREPATDPVAEAGPLLAGAGPVAGSEASIGGIDGENFPYNYYLEIVRNLISQQWEVPQGLVARGRRIQSVVRFRIMRDGTVRESIIEEPSGQTVYDQAGLRAIASVRKFPPLPQEFGGQFLVVHFQFAFVGR